MTHNDLIGAIAKRIRELSNETTDQLRLQHPEIADSAPENININMARRILKGRSREDLIADVLVEEFSEEYDYELR